MANSMSAQMCSRTSTGALSQQPTLVGSNTPPQQPSGEALKRAIVAFRNRLTGKDLAEFRGTTYVQLCQDILRIQKDQESRTQMMDLSRIRSCLEAMHQFGKVIEVFLNMSDILAFVWGPMKFLLLTASTYVGSFDALLDAYAQIGEQLPLLSDYESLFHKSPHMVSALEMMYIDILDFHQQALKFFSGKLWIRFFKSMWKDFDTKFGGMLKSLARHKDLVECRATVSQYRRYQEDMVELKSKLEETISAEKEKKKLAVKEWLAVDGQQVSDHESFRQIRKECATTAQWILKHHSVEHWMQIDVPDTPVLWMNAIPGAGKTILASAIIDECNLQPNFTTSYFYCREGDQASSSTVGILKALADQLLDQHPSLIPHCHTKRTQSGEPTLRSLSQAQKLLEDLCSAIPKLFIIVDGLDECERADRVQALEVLTKIAAECDTDEPGKLRILFVSQDYADIRRALFSTAIGRAVPNVIQLSDSDNKSDIHTYTRVWVEKIATKFEPFTDDMKDYLLNLTVANAKGMFLYAKLVMQNLYVSPTRTDLMVAIKQENFPDGLQEAYERILSRIKRTCGDKEWAKTKRLLGWMVCAKRRLTWKEIQVALSIDLDDQTVEYDDRRLRTHIYDICGSLVLLSGDRVSLVHSTAKIYIANVTKDIHEPSIECELAALCLQYLTFPCFEVEDPGDPEILKQFALNGHFALQDYAIAKWFHHVNAWVNSGDRFLEGSTETESYLSAISYAVDDFMSRYEDEDWENGLVRVCTDSCKVFQDYLFFDNLVLLTSHIYTFQQKGFEARHKVSIQGLAKALERNRKFLEELPAKLSKDEMMEYRKFYDAERRFKCTKITCMYFSEGFKDAKARKKHVNIHDRPFQCEVLDCIGAEGFANSKDLEKHTRAFHPEISDLAETFNSTTAKPEKATHACTICGKTFTRNFHRKNHELSHRGERPHECVECGKAFTRLNDLKRHQKLHDRK